MTDDGTRSPLLRATDIRTAFLLPDGSTFRAVDGVSFELNAGETLGIVGESGSGKSMLVRSIMNLLPASARVEGTVTYKGDDVAQMTAAQRKHFWGPELAMVFQDPMTSLNPVRRIGQQISDPIRHHLRLSRRAARERALELLDLVQVPDPRRRIDQFPHELSGGMRQRVGIAIALACDPAVLIADEPTTALDVTVQKQILDLLDSLQAKLGMAMILISHDLGVVAGRARRTAVMYAGRFVEEAGTVPLFAAPRHRYTEALFGSIPRISERPHTRLASIPGRPPNPRDLPRGCSFAPRCAHVREGCDSERPALVATAGDPDHRHRCIFPAPAPSAPEAH